MRLTAGQEKISELKFVYFDQNVSEPASQCKHKSYLLDNIIHPKWLQRKKIYTTPYTAVEYSGVRLVDLFNNKRYEVNKNNNIQEEMNKAYDFYKNNMKPDIQELLLKGLRDNREPRVKTEKGEYASDIGKILLEHYKQYISGDGFIKGVPYSFIMDRVSDLNFDKNEDPNNYLYLMKLALAVLNFRSDINVTRLIFKSLQSCTQYQGIEYNPKTMNHDEYKSFKQVEEKFKERAFNKGKDLVDTEIIHLACFGIQKKPLYIVTGDKPDKINQKIDFYLNAIKLLSKGYKIDISFPENYGIVTCINKDTFEKAEDIDISDKVKSVDLSVKNTLSSPPLGH